MYFLCVTEHKCLRVNVLAIAQMDLVQGRWSIYVVHGLGPSG